MLISYSNNFIYFKAVKVSGTSVQVALAENCKGKNDVITPVAHNSQETPGFKAKNYKNRYESHDTPSKIIKTVDKKFWDECTKICVVRNPWAAIASRYKAWCKNKEFRIKYPTLNHYIKDKGLSNIYVNTSFYFFSNGEMTADIYMRQENIKEDYHNLCLKNGFKEIDLPRLKIAKDTRHYSHFIDDKLAIKIKREYNKEIKTFGYSFERKEDYNPKIWE